MSKILKFILLSSILLCGWSLKAQTPAKVSTKSQKQEPEKKDTLNVPLWQGFMLEYDVEPLIEAAFLQNSNYTFHTYQGNLQVNLKNKYFPVVEFGMSGAERTTTVDGNHFKADGMFGKIGMDFSLLKPKPGTKIIKNFFLAGVRVGMSHFNYTIDNLTVTDNYWGGTEPLAFTQPTTKFWFEIVAGVRVSVFKNIYLGWNIRNKHLLNAGDYGSVQPWNIPGYGIGNTSAWGFSYIIGYHF